MPDQVAEEKDELAHGANTETLRTWPRWLQKDLERGETMRQGKTNMQLKPDEENELHLASRLQILPIPNPHPLEIAQPSLSSLPSLLDIVQLKHD